MRTLSQAELGAVSAGASHIQNLAVMSAIAAASLLIGGFFDWLTFALGTYEPQIICTCVIGVVGTLTGAYQVFLQ